MCFLYISYAAAEIEQPKSRTKRDVNIIVRDLHHSPVTTWGSKFGEGGACITSKAKFGICTTFKTCYPYFKKIPDLSIFDSWVLGQYDTYVLLDKLILFYYQIQFLSTTFIKTLWFFLVLLDSCTFFTDDGRQAFGVCCDNPPIKDNKNPPAIMNDDFSPNKDKVWPPPYITHAPDHTAPTHAPQHG